METINLAQKTSNNKDLLKQEKIIKKNNKEIKEEKHSINHDSIV